MSDGPPKFKFYQYDPSLPAAVIFALCFLGSTGLHIFHMIKFRTWYWVPFVLGGLFQVFGYLFRAASSKDQTSLGPYLGQTLLLLLAPALYAASVYMVLGRIVQILPNGERHSPIRHNWMTKIFVIGDVLSFLMQSGGGGILGTADGDPDKTKMGENLVIGGLFVQLIFFGFFMVVSVIFWMRYHKNEVIDKHALDNSPEGRWRLLFKVLFVSSFLILVRSIFRTIEYMGGHDGYLLKKEIFLYIFDAVLMLLTMVLFNWVFPGTVISGRKNRKGLPLEGGYAMGASTSYLRD